MNFSPIITFGTAPGIEVTPLYEGSIGWLAASIGMLAALSLLPTMERVAAARSVNARQSWIFAGAASMAVGVCAMFYSALFGMTVPIHARLDISAVVLAPLPGFLAFAVMIHLVGVPSVNGRRLHLAALLCSCGLCGMHYVVLLSLGLDATMVIDAGAVFVPLAIGYAGTMVGLYAYFGLAGTATNSLLRKLLGSALITYSTIGNHFSAMGQTRFFTQQPLATYTPLMHPDALPVIVILVSVIVGLLWIGSMVDERLSGAILAVEESEERSRAVINNMLDAHVTADSNGLIQSFNPAAEQLFGYTLAEVIGQPVQMLVVAEHRAATSTATLRAIADGGEVSSKSAQYENAGLHKNGKTFPVEIVTNRLRTRGGMYFSAIIRDLTADRAAKAELQLLGAAVENANEPICITSVDRIIVYGNRAWERRMSLSRDEMLGKPLYSLQKYPGDRSDSGNPLRRRSESGDVWGGTVTTELPDGRRLNEELLVTTLRKSDGTPTHYVSTWRDISAKLEMEQQLLRSQKLQAVGQLAAGIAHELNTPIQYVSDNIRFLKDSFRDISTFLNRISELGTTADDGMILSSDISTALAAADAAYLLDEIPKAMDQSLDGVGRVSTILHAMKDFSHPATERTQLDINRAIEGTATVASNEWKYVADLHTDFDPDLPVVPVMPGDFNQMILNMIVNAAHAIGEVVGDDGGKGRGLITLSTRRVNDKAEIRISDTGCGMTPETAARIFDPFFTTKAVGKGTGQGLAMAHNVVVVRHGGTIGVESTRGVGTTFIIRLPLQVPDAAALPGSASEAA